MPLVQVKEGTKVGVSRCRLPLWRDTQCNEMNIHNETWPQSECVGTLCAKTVCCLLPSALSVCTTAYTYRWINFNCFPVVVLCTGHFILLPACHGGTIYKQHTDDLKVQTIRHKDTFSCAITELAVVHLLCSTCTLRHREWTCAVCGGYWLKL